MYEVSLEGDTGALVARVEAIHVADIGEPSYAVGDVIYYQYLYDHVAGDRLLFFEGDDKEITTTFDLDEDGNTHCWGNPEVDFSPDDVASLVLGDARESCEDRLLEDFNFDPYPDGQGDQGSGLIYGCSTGMNRAGAGSAHGLIACIIFLAGLGMIRRK